MTRTDTSIALQRFGLGPRPGERARIGSDPRGALLEELADPRLTLLLGHDLPPGREALVIGRTARRELDLERAADTLSQRNRTVLAKLDEQLDARIAGEGPRLVTLPSVKAPPQPVPAFEARFRREVEARLDHARRTPHGFVERLVGFWSNHFCIDARKGADTRDIAGAYEREAIRPHVLGRFEDMLMAVVRHPGMLSYLDNSASIGPNSPEGLRRKRGLNENLAREILELHTLGVDGGYTQADVTAFARVLTGWTYWPYNAQDGDPGTFRFINGTHEPGAQVVLSRTFSAPGVEQGKEVLRLLARHPATARHLTFKLARHVVADEPPPALVERLRRTFLDTGGDLAEVSRALVRAPEAWQPQPVKFRTPQEHLFAYLRGTQAEVKPDMHLRVLPALGQAMWQPPSPKGYADEAGEWASGEALVSRFEATLTMARTAPRDLDARALAEDLLGQDLSAETRRTVAGAETREQAIALLFMSPEMLRR